MEPPRHPPGSRHSAERSAHLELGGCSAVYPSNIGIEPSEIEIEPHKMGVEPDLAMNIWDLTNDFPGKTEV